MQPDKDHLRPWRGYLHDVCGHLTQTHKDPGLPGYHMDPSGLVNHAVTPNDILNLSTAANAEVRDLYRDGDLGSLESIVSSDDGLLFDAERDSAHKVTQIVQSNGTTYYPEQDGAGRTTKTSSHALLYDPLDRLLRANIGAQDEHYVYTDDGRLAAVYDDSGALEQRFSWDGPHMIGATAGNGNKMWDVAWGPGLNELIHWRDGTNGDTQVALMDHRKNVVGLFDADEQTVVDIFEYDEHGRLTHRDGDETLDCVDDKYPCAARTDMPFLFGGAWRSSVTGISFMRNRWYDAKERQFLTTDPLLFVDSFDLYAYAGFDPVNRWDPWGLYAESTAMRANKAGIGQKDPTLGQHVQHALGDIASDYTGPGLKDTAKRGLDDSIAITSGIDDPRNGMDALMRLDGRVAKRTDRAGERAQGYASMGADAMGAFGASKGFGKGAQGSSKLVQRALRRARRLIPKVQKKFSGVKKKLGRGGYYFENPLSRGGKNYQEDKQRQKNSLKRPLDRLGLGTFTTT